MYFIIATEKYTLNVYFSVTVIMELVEWVSFVLIMFKVVVLAAFGVVDTANLSPLLLIQQNALFLLKLNNYFAPTNICVETNANPRSFRNCETRFNIFSHQQSLKTFLVYKDHNKNIQYKCKSLQS